MGSGRKELQINTQERAISTDINRLQKFASADSAEFFRYMMNVSGNDDLDAGSVVTEYATAGTPLRAEIVNGLLVRPQGGSLDLLVDPGVLMAIAPDAAADDSNYKFVRDPGILIIGLLAMTANAAATIRIDVIEVQVANAVDASENDNRDIYNPATGLFVATAVTKARKSNVTAPGNIRVRTGVAGAGYPAAVSGWLPICVASVAAFGATNDDITFWDVRPLVSDREFGLANLTRDMPVISRMEFDWDASILTGVIEGVLNGRRVGGRMRRGSPGVTTESINFTQAANQEPGLVIPGGGDLRVYYMYLATPFGLPRWARYTDGPANRVPRSPRGIPILSNTPATTGRGTPSVALTLPTATGLGVTTTTSALCCAVLPLVSGLGARNKIRPSSSACTLLGIDAASMSTFTLIDGTTHPANARILHFFGAMFFVVAANYDSGINSASIWADLYRPGGGAIVSTSERVYIYASNQTGAPVTNGVYFEFSIPLLTGYPNTTEGNRTLIVNLVKGGAAWTPGSGFQSLLQLVGWEL